MNDSLLMKIGQRLNRLKEESAGLFRFELSFPADILVQIDALDVFEGQEENAVGLAELEKIDDVFMTELGESAGLAAKLLQGKGMVSQSGQQDLQGHRLAAFLIEGLIDDAHAAGGNVLQQLVFADLAAPQFARGHYLSCHQLQGARHNGTPSIAIPQLPAFSRLSW
jgi:hypothetical protein